MRPSPRFFHGCWLRLLGWVLVQGLSLAAAPVAHPAHPGLFFGAEDLTGLRNRSQTPYGQAIDARLQALLAQTPEPGQRGSHAAGWAVRFTLGGQPADAARALALCEAVIADPEPAPDPLTQRGPHPWPAPGRDVLRVPAIVGLAIAYDLCAPSWPEDRRAAIAQALAATATQLGQTPSRTPATAEQAMLQAAGGLAALAVAPDWPANSGLDQLATTARQQVARFLADCGDRGWPRENLHGLRLALSQSLPAFLLAWRHTRGEDLATQSTARYWASLYTMLLLPPARLGAAPGVALFGQPQHPTATQPAPAWEFSPWCGGDLLAQFGLTDAGSRAAVQWIFDRTFGLAGDRTFDIAKPGDALFALLLYPGEETALPPATTIGHGWRDDRAGVFICRNRWVDANDAVAAFTANARPLRGLASFADAGSFRLSALGGHWAVSRQRDTTDLREVSRERENVVAIPGTHGWLAGRVTYAALQPDGSAAVTVELDDVYTVAPASGRPERLDTTQDIGIRARRAWAVDYSGDCGAPVLLAVVDQIAGGPPRRWLWHTAEREVRLRTDGFDIQAASGATLHATVITPHQPRLSLTRGEWTDSIAIDGDGDFFVLVTVQPAGAAHPTLQVEGLDLQAHVRLGRCSLRYDGRSLLLQ